MSITEGKVRTNMKQGDGGSAPIKPPQGPGKKEFNLREKFYEETKIYPSVLTFKGELFSPEYVVWLQNKLEKIDESLKEENLSFSRHVINIRDILNGVKNEPSN